MNETKAIICTLLIFGVLFCNTHASCTRGSNGMVKFGSTCNYMCHCKDATEQCGDADGTCTTSGCANAWMGPGCQYRDIAFSEFTNHKNNINPPEYSERAADGYLETCSRTYTSTDNPWWRFWLPQKELITGLVLITDPEVLGNFKSFKVTVENASNNIKGMNEYTNQQTCYATSSGNPASKIIEVTCDKPLFNNQIRVTIDSPSTQLVICDIRVFGGKNVAFGRQASQSSYGNSNSNAAQTVDGLVGTSVDECSATQVQDRPWWKVDLKHIMRIQAIRISTFKDDGLLNFQLYAKKDSSWIKVYDDAGKNPPTKNITRLIETRFLLLWSPRQSVRMVICEVQLFGECAAGRWGPGCDFLCGSCLNTGACSGQTGHCPHGCSDGYKTTETCETRCLSGLYGTNCSQKCSDHCKGGYTYCNIVNGTCKQLCEAGWKGVMCDQGCLPGSYGENCIQNCSDHCKGGNTNCNNVNGTCKQLCEAGWKGVMCDQECDAGFYGIGCKENCSENCQHILSCNKINGFCECKAGWKGNICEQKCPNGTHGINCTGTCGHCNGGSVNCNKLTGACKLGCAEEYGGDACTTELSTEPSIPLTAILGGAIAVVAVIVAVLLILVFVRRRNIRKEDQSKPLTGNQTGVPGDVLGSNNDTGESVQDEPSERDNVYINSNALVSMYAAGDGGNDKLGTSTTKSTSLLEPAVVENESECEYYNISPQRYLPNNAILLSHLRKFIASKSSESDIFHQQYSTLPKGLKHPTTVALKPKNRPKNRYKEMYAYDQTRVVLQTLPGKEDSDYINASFINGHKMEKAYIAAQGPTKVNIVDFWRMIWEMNVTKIVMATNAIEDGKDKCQQYWDSNEPSSYGSLSITVSSEEIMAEFTIRTFIVKSISQNKQRTITHYHFTAWPDKCTPKGPTGLVQFWSKVQKDEIESTHPWLVHCSAGVGRTGTFIALDILYDQGRQLEYVNVYQCVRELRQQRVNMVQTQDQYRYLHDIVHEALILPSLAIPVSDFEKEYRELIQDEHMTGMTRLMSQFQIQEDVIILSKEDVDDKVEVGVVKDVYAAAKLPENKNKNRHNNILASDEYRPFLSTYISGCNDYINAVFIPSYRQLRGFIISQTPLEHTAIDCCRLIYDMEIDVVVAFADNGTEKIGIYLPDQSTLNIRNFQVELMSEEQRSNYTIRNYNLHFKKQNKQVKQILFTKWPCDETVPRDQEAMLSLIQEVTEQQHHSDDKPILVQCLNGAERSGMFVVLMNVFERMRIEQEVAIPPVIRNLRHIRQQIIPSYEQYKFCHEAVLRHLQDTSTYANI